MAVSFLWALCLASSLALSPSLQGDSPSRTRFWKLSRSDETNTAFSRRMVIDKLRLLTPCVVLGPGVSSGPATATNLKKFNAKLSTLGLTELSSIPNGFNAILESYTQSNPKLLVEFFYPNSWLAIRPSINTNGEAGTVSAGDYGKGDSAALFVSDASKDSKDFYQKVLIGGISQRGDNQYQNFAIIKVRPGTIKDYVLVDFEYELLTGAGFVVERRGVGSITTIGSKAPVLIAVTTASRWKKLEPTLRTVADSFRAYEQTAADIDLGTDI